MKKRGLEYLKIRTGGCWGPWLSVDVVHTDEGLRYRYIYPYGVSQEDVSHEGEYRPGDNEATSDWLTRLEGLKLYRWWSECINDVIIDGSSWEIQIKKKGWIRRKISGSLTLPQHPERWNALMDLIEELTGGF